MLMNVAVRDCRGKCGEIRRSSTGFRFACLRKDLKHIRLNYGCNSIFCLAEAGYNMSLSIACCTTPLRARRRICAALIGLMSLSACEAVPPEFLRLVREQDQTKAFASMPLSQSWIPVQRANMVLQRELSETAEQRIGLYNQTAIPGDNFIALRASAFDGRAAGRLRFEEFVQAAGGLPTPFSSLTSGDLSGGEDDLGTYLWAEQRVGDSVVCVLALRRLGSDVRQLPGGANALDIMLRNCVVGSAERALAPVMAETINGDTQGVGTPLRGTVKMLSPLAGPTP
jgi:hypothetical protein